LAARYIENFKLFADGSTPEVVNAGPKRLKDILEDVSEDKKKKKK